MGEYSESYRGIFGGFEQPSYTTTISSNQYENYARYYYTGSNGSIVLTNT